MAHVTMKEMLDAGVHFGHQTQRWNPKMKPYVFTARGGIHIIDLQKSVAYANAARDYVKSVAAKGGTMIFVGTKKQAAEVIQGAAEKCGQHYVTKRWLGGMLTNFQTIQESINRLKKIDQMRSKGELDFFSKKERAGIEKEYARLSNYLEGIRDMKKNPAAMFVVDLNKEHIAVAEAKRLGIAVVGIADTNSDPTIVDYPIPGNDDAIRSIKLFANMVADAFNEGAKDWEVEAQRLAEEERKQAEKAEEEEKTSGKEEAAATGDGPAVVKVSRGRKLVAAGTADLVEIEQELAAKESGETTPEETPETTETASTEEETTEKE